MQFEDARLEFATRNKRGIHLIVASMVVWIAIGVLWTVPLVTGKWLHYLTLACGVLALPLSLLVALILRAEFSVPESPVNGLNLALAFHQYLYYLLAGWICYAAPDKLMMAMAIIYGAQLLPYGWLYRSKLYYGMAVAIPALALGLTYFLGKTVPFVVPVAVVVMNIVMLFALAGAGDELPEKDWRVRRFGREEEAAGAGPRG